MATDEAKRRENVKNPSDQESVHGKDDAKRRRIVHASHEQESLGTSLVLLRSLQSNTTYCRNCLGNDHVMDQCPNEGANDWKILIDF